MLLQDFFQTLSFGELSNLSIGGEGSGVVPAGQHDKLSSLTNAALREISTRMPYKVGYVKFRTTAAQASYTLVPGAAFLLEDTPGDFTDVVSKIVSVSRIDNDSTYEDEGYDLYLNERNGAVLNRHLRVLGQDTVVFAEPTEGADYLVEYRAVPKMLTLPTVLTEKIDIPVVLYSALTFLVASKVYGQMNGDSTTLRSRELMASYGQEISLIEEDDLLNDSEVDNFDLLRSRGYV